MPRKRRKPKIDLKPILEQPASFEIAPDEFSYGKKQKRVSIGSQGINKLSIIKHVKELEIGPLLGEGAEGKVYLAKHSKTNLNLAVKVVEILDRAKRKQFRRDLQVLQNIHSKYLTKCYDMFFKNRENEVWICLEYMDCGSLCRILGSAGIIPEIALKKIAYCILQGLKSLRESKTYHRDIKPANILVNRQGVAKIADFGISKTENESASISKGFGQGTLRYLSPERIKGTAQGGFAADIWALGLILFESATGQHPFDTSTNESPDARTTVRLFKSIMTDDIPLLLDQFSSEFKDFVHCCLEREPENRPDENQLLQHSWLLDAGEIDLRPFAQNWLHPEAKKLIRLN